MKNLKHILVVVLAIALIAVSMPLAFADTYRLGANKFSFSPTAQVTKTAAYTLTTSDSYVKFTASTADIVATLPSISGLSGVSIAYKIEKTDSTGYNIVVTPASGDTIGGESTRKLTYSGANMIIQSGPGKNWTISYESPYSVEDYEAGTVDFMRIRTGIGIVSAKTTSTTLTHSDCGKTIAIATDALTTTLPLAIAGCKFKFINTGAAGNNILDIAANASDAFYGTLYNTSALGATIVTSSTGSTLSNTKATAKKGDYVMIESTGANTWIISGNSGTWTTK